MTESRTELVSPNERETPPPSINNNHDHVDMEDPPAYDNLDQSDSFPPPYSPSFATTVNNRMFDIPEAPPDYFSVVANRLQDARRDSNDISSFCLKTFRTLIFAVAVILILIVLISIPVAMVAIGIGYLGDCPIEPMIPVYLIMAGVCGIIKSIEALLKQVMVCSMVSSLQSCLRKWKKHPKLKYFLLVWRICDVIFNLLLLGLFIAGSYWVFHLYAGLRERGFPIDECHPILYKISFGVMVSSYIVLALTCCCVCGCALCRNNETEQIPQPARLRRTIEQEVEPDVEPEVFNNRIRSNEFYEEATEFGDDFASVDIPLDEDTTGLD